MRAYREQLIGDLAGGDQTQSDFSERPYDRQRALMQTQNRLAIAIKRLQAETKTANQGAMNTVVYELHKLVHAKYPQIRLIDMTEQANLCRMAIEERLHTQCRACLGKGELRLPGTAVIICGTCNGSTLRKYSDDERAQRLGKPLTRQHERILNEAQSLFLFCESLADGLVAKKMAGYE